MCNNMCNSMSHRIVLTKLQSRRAIVSNYISSQVWLSGWKSLTETWSTDKDVVGRRHCFYDHIHLLKILFMCNLIVTLLFQWWFFIKSDTSATPTKENRRVKKASITMNYDPWPSIPLFLVYAHRHLVHYNRYTDYTTTVLRNNC